MSRESQLRHLAQWFTGLPTDDDAHALFQAVFGLGAPRHVAAGYEDPDLIPGRKSWWEAEPVALARTLVRTGRVSGLQGPGRIQRDDEAKSKLRAEQLKATMQRREANSRLASDGVYERILDEPETAALLSLLGIALTARVPVSRAVTDTGRAGPVATGSADGVRLTLRPAPGSTMVQTVRGRLHLDGLAIEITGATPTPPSTPAPTSTSAPAPASTSTSTPAPAAATVPATAGGATR